MDELIENISSPVKLSEESKRDIIASVKVFNYPKGYELEKPGKIAKHLYFLKKGIGRVYYHNKDKEVTEFISMEAQFLGDFDSFFQQKPSKKFAELLEDSVILEISYNKVQELLNKHRDIERLALHLSSRAILRSNKRVQGLLFTTALERYRTLLANQPDIINRVSLGIIASYLGISQETLSRIRAQV